MTNADSAPGITLGLRANWPQFSLLLLINAFVGGMVGLERTVVPLIGSEEFNIASTTLVVSFIVSFGLVKALANLVSGQLADVWGRKRVLVIGWLFGLPVPFMVMWGPSWEWVVLANALLGINQGFAWSMTVIMKVDLVGPKSRGLAVGLNEFAGYLAVGVTAFLTGYIASRYGLRPAPFYLGIGYAILGLALSILLVRDTREHVRLEARGNQQQAAPTNFWEIFALTSFRDRNLFAACQAGLVNNLNDGMSWGIFPLFFVSFGLGVERIGILKAVYPAAWGILQVATGPLSDRWGRKGLIVSGMWVQAAGLFLTALTRSFEWWLLGCVDGFDQDEAESKRDERAVILRRLLASECDTLEAFELADRLFDACPCLVECFRKEGRHILGVGSIRDGRTYSALARGVAI